MHYIIFIEVMHF